MNLPGFMTRNWRLKLASTGVALVSWVGVVYAGNPPETKTVSVAVPQSPEVIPAQFVLVTPVSNISLHIGGNRQSLNAFSTSSLQVIVNWRSVDKAGMVNVPISITNSDPNVQLIDPPSTITANLDNLSSTTLQVNPTITAPPPPGYVVSSESTNPSSVVVAGAQHELAGLHASVKADLSNRKTNVEAELDVLVYDSHDNQVTNLSSIDPNTVRLTITVSASQTSRASAVVPNTVGNPPSGHELLGIHVTPATVVLSGPQDLLNALDSVPTSNLFLNAVTGSITLNVPVTPPAGVTASPGTVAVTIDVITLPTPTQAPTPTPTARPSPTPTPTAPSPSP